MLVSGGSLVVTKRPDILTWRGRTDQITGAVAEILGGWTSYAALYERQPWINAAVKKLASATGRLPLKTYQRTATGRDDARDTPYGQLLRRPNKRIDPVTLWRWVSSTEDIFGESFLGKVRDAGGRPVELVPLHPTWMHYDTSDQQWTVDDGKRRFKIDRRDFIHFRYYSPNGVRGLSPLEPLRSTLENEEGARRANSAMWRNGGRPSVVLSHPRTLSDPAAERIAASWADIHGGVDNWAKAAVLEEGLTATVLPLNVEELQYIEARKLNREEVCGVYDIPPPVLHILDRATFSNITEQLRSMYRDTMAPRIGAIESTLEHELRDGRMGADTEPDFPDNVYAEFLMDEVLRGDFEVRVNAWATAINTGQVTPDEARRAENRPFVEGSDKLLINAALVPVGGGTGGDGMSPRELAEGLQKIYLAVGKVISAEEAREILNRGGANLTGPAPVAEIGAASEPLKSLSPTTVRTLMGRLGRASSVADIEARTFIAGLNGETEAALNVLACGQGDTLDQFKARLRALTEA